MNKQSYLKWDQLLADSRSLYKDQPIMQRRVELALGQFTENMKNWQQTQLLDT